MVAAAAAAAAVLAVLAVLAALAAAAAAAVGVLQGSIGLAWRPAATTRATLATLATLAMADSFAELRSEAPRQPAALVLTFLVANILLTGLQFFWGFLIAKGVLKKIRGQKDD